MNFLTVSPVAQRNTFGVPPGPQAMPRLLPPKPALAGNGKNGGCEDANDKKYQDDVHLGGQVSHADTGEQGYGGVNEHEVAYPVAQAVNIAHQVFVEPGYQAGFLFIFYLVAK